MWNAKTEINVHVKMKNSQEKLKRGSRKIIILFAGGKIETFSIPPECLCFVCFIIKLYYIIFFCIL